MSFNTVYLAVQNELHSQLLKYFDAAVLSKADFTNSCLVVSLTLREALVVCESVHVQLDIVSS